MEAYHTNPL